MTERTLILIKPDGVKNGHVGEIISRIERKGLKLAEAFREGGVQDVTLKIFPQARHELFNETNRDEVTGLVIGWLDDHLPTKGA